MAEVIEKTVNDETSYDVTLGADENSVILATANTYVDKNIVFNIKNSIWNGKKAIFFGDSRTWYNNNAYVNTAKDDLVGTTCKGYQQTVADRLGITYDTDAASARTSAAISTRIKAKNLTDYDLIILNGGVNDFIVGGIAQGELLPIGSTFDATTIYGAWQSAIEYILNNYPSKKIIMTTPAIAWQNGVVYPKELAMIKKKVAQLYNIPCFDAYHQLGINEVNRAYFYCDDVAKTDAWYLHFNDEGNEWYGNMLANYILSENTYQDETGDKITNDMKNSLVDILSHVNGYSYANSTQAKNALNDFIDSWEIPEYENITIADVAMSNGYNNLTIDNGSFVFDSAVNFCIVELDPTITELKVTYRDTGSFSNSTKNFLFKDNGDNTYYGIDSGTNIFKFTKGTSAATAVKDTSTTYERVVTGTFNDGDECIITLKDETLTMTDTVTGATCTIAGANCVGWWGGASNNVTPYTTQKKIANYELKVGTTDGTGTTIDTSNLMENPLYGKTIITFGDSISYGVGYTGGYGKTIADKYGATLINQSVDGATLAFGVADTVKGGYRTSISTKIKEYTGYANVDYIILEGGINDAWAGEDACAIGRLSTTNADFNVTTLLGGLESALMFLQTNWSDKKIIFVFPHAGMLALDHFWHAKAKPAIKKALVKWNIPYVDIQYSTPLIGPYGIDTSLKTKYLSDNTHPNQTGYETFYTDQIFDLMIRRNSTGPCPVVETTEESSSTTTPATVQAISTTKIDELFD